MHGDNRITVVPDDGHVYGLPLILGYADEFEWGFAGYAPLVTALSILADHLGEDQSTAPRGCAHFHSKQFLDRFIINADHSGFTLSTKDIDQWLKTQSPCPPPIPA